MLDWIEELPSPYGTAEMGMGSAAITVETRVGDSPTFSFRINLAVVQPEFERLGIHAVVQHT